MAELNEETGRELKATDLRPRTIVVIQPPGKTFAITMWVDFVDTERRLVTFHSEVMHWVVLNSYDEDGVIHDDQGRVVRVYEYLGEP